MPQIALSSHFLKAFGRIPRNQQTKVRSFTEKFRRDPTSNGINYEKLEGIADDKVRSVRIDQSYRAIVVHPPAGDVYMLVWVDHHDEAYRWVERKRFDVNPTTGAMQVYEVQEVEALLPEATAPTEPAPSSSSQTGWEEEIPAGRLLTGRTVSELLQVGVPQLLIPSVKALRFESDLDELAPYLPQEASDALYMFVSGYTLSEVLRETRALQPIEQVAPEAVEVDTRDFAKALDRPESQRDFKVVESETELDKILDAPLDLWRVFLHPTQAELVRWSLNGPARVLGGAGTGKTVVLLHRAKYLAREVFDSADDRILVTTYTRNLAYDLEHLLRTMCGEEMDRIFVTNLHAWASSFMRGQGMTFDIVTQSQSERYWTDAITAAGGSEPLPSNFYQDEWEQVVQAHDITDKRSYFTIVRTGRGTGLGRKQRAAVWKVFERYRANLEADGKVEWADIIREARLYIEQNPGVLPYSAVLADEVQDFRPADLKLLRAMVDRDENDLFLVGDAHQRIYGYQVSFGQCGIEIRGRSRRLKINYRTTEEIRDWSVQVLEGLSWDDLDGGKDNLDGYRSLRNGAPPAVTIFQTPEQEQRHVIETVERWLEAGHPHEICIGARTNKLLQRYAQILGNAGIETVTIKTDEELAEDAVRLSTMHRMKGLEFPKVLLAGVHKGEVPQNLLRSSFADDQSWEDFLKRERSLLYVAATRARDELVVTGFGTPSELMPTMGSDEEEQA